MKRLALLLCAAAFVAVGCVLASGEPSQGGGDASSECGKAGTPPAAAYLPLDVERRLALKGCKFFLSVRAASLLEEVDPADLVGVFSSGMDADNVGSDLLKSIQKATGWAPSDLDRVTFFGASTEPREAVFIVSSKKALDRTKFVKAWAEGALEVDSKNAQLLEPTARKIGGQRYLVRRDEAIFFPNLPAPKKANPNAKPPAADAVESSHVLVIGRTKAIETILGGEPKDVVWENDATKLLTLAGEKQALAAAYVGPHFVVKFRQTLDRRDDFALLTDSTHMGILAFADKKGIRITLPLTYEDPATAEKAEVFGRKFVAQVPVVVTQTLNAMQVDPLSDAGRKLNELADQAGAAVNNATLQRQGRQLTLTMSLPRDLWSVIRTINEYNARGKAKASS